MSHIFQFYKKHWSIPKKDYTTETRQKFQNWDKQISSQVGYLKEKQLFLPFEKRNLIRLNSVSGIILQDVIGQNSSKEKLHLQKVAEANDFPDWFNRQQLANLDSQNPELAVYSSQKKIWDFEIFSIEKNTNKEFEIHLRYKVNEFRIGKPGRNDHKLCILKKNTPVKISINGKSDSTMSSGKERSYSEYEYIIEYQGESDSIEFKDLNKIETQKDVPQKFIKHIDLRKILY